MPTPSPLVLVSTGGPSTPPPLDVSPGATVSVVLESPTGVTNWYLQVGLVIGNPPMVVPGTGTDELSSPPTLNGTNPSTGLVTGGPTSTVTFTFPNATGRAILLSSTVTGGFGSITTTFAIFSLASNNLRVGAAGMTREGDSGYGWTSIVNPVIRLAGALPPNVVTDVTGTAPIASSGGTTPDISFGVTGEQAGDLLYLSSTGWARVPKGGSGQYLAAGTTGPDFEPSWQSVISGITVQYNGSTVTGSPFGTQNFTGPGVSVANVGGVATITIGATGSPVPDASSTNASPVSIATGSNPGTIVTSVTVTPEFTGKLVVTGFVVAETTAAAGDTAYLIISHGASPGSGDFVGDGVTVPGPSGNEAQLAISIQYGTSFSVSLPAFPIGTPVQINLAVGSAAGNISVPTHGAQLNVREIGMSTVFGGPLSGDVVGAENSTVVTAIQGMPTPAGNTGSVGDALVVGAGPALVYTPIVTSVGVSAPITSTGGATPTLGFSVASEAPGDLLYLSSTGWARVPKGTSGQFLGAGTTGPDYTPTWATPSSGGGGFADNATSQRTRQNNWLRRNEFGTGGEGGSNSISLSALGIPSLADTTSGSGTANTGKALALLGDKLFIVGYDGTNSGVLYGIDTFLQQSVTFSGPVSGSPYALTQYKQGGTGDAPVDLIGVRGMNSVGTSAADYLFGAFPNQLFVELGTVSGTSGSMSYSQAYHTVVASAPVRACLVGGGGQGNPTFAFSAANGHIYIVDDTGTAHDAYTGTDFGALFVDDSGYLWALNPTTGALLKFSINFTSYTLTLVQTISTGLTAVYDLTSDGRYIWVLGANGSSYVTLAAFDIGTGTAGPVYNPVGTNSPGTYARILWDGIGLIVGTGALQVVRVEPNTGEPLWISDPVGTSLRATAIDSSGQVFYAPFQASHVSSIRFAASTFEDRSFNSIRYLGRPLQFVNGGRQQGQATVLVGSATPPNVFASPFTFTPNWLTALCRTSTGAVTINSYFASFTDPNWLQTVIDIEGQASTNPIVMTPQGAQMEDPNNPGTFTLGTISLNKNWQAVTWVWVPEFSVWKVLNVSFNAPQIAGSFTRPILAGASSTVNGSGNPLRVGSLYFNPADEKSGYKVYFRVVIETTNASNAVVIDLSDVNNVLGNGVGAEVPGSQLTTTSTTEVVMSVELTALEAGTLGGLPILLDCRLWLNPANGTDQATCSMAQLVIQ